MDVSQYKDIEEKELELSLKEIFKDMVKYFPSKLSGLLGNTAVIPIYTNLLSVEQYGIYTLTIAFLSFLCIIFSDWVGLSGLRFFKHHEIKDEISKYLSTLIGLLVANIIVMFILAIIFKSYFCSFFKLSTNIFFMVLFLIIPVAVRALFFQILRAQIKPIAFTISTIINQILTILISVVLIKTLNWGAYAMLMGMVISITFTDILLIFQSNISKHFGFSKPKWEILSSLYLYGIPLSITSISLWGINQSNRFILGRLYSFNEVGLSGVAYGVTFPILSTLFVVISLAAIPRIIHMYEEKINVRPIISRLTGYYCLLALPIIVLYSIYSKEVINLLANPKFAAAYIVVPYLAVSCFVHSLTDYTTLQYNLSKKTYIDTIIRVFSGLVGLALNIILIKKMGLLGMGIATMLGNLLHFVLTLIVVIPGLSWQVPYKKLINITVSFVPPAFIYLFVFNEFSINAAIEASLLYAVYYLSYYVVSRFINKTKVSN